MQTRVQVFTFRDGFLARLAHDLRLTVGAFELRLEHGKLEGWFDPASLRVDGVAHGERVDPEALSPADRAKIHENLTREVLETGRYPRIELQAAIRRTPAGFAVEGLLRLHGREQPVSTVVKLDDVDATAEVELTPSLFGIAPFKALGGAIRLQDRVRVCIRVLAGRDTLETAGAREEETCFRPS